MIEKKLPQTLDSRMGYTAAEIRNWISYRHPLTHLDQSQRDVPHGEAALRPFMRRMEQAALDVLFNKAEWGTWSSSRRHVRPSSTYLRGQSGQWTVGGFASTTLGFMFLDEFGVYPRGKFLLTVPKEWRALTQLSAGEPETAEDQ